MRCLVTGGNGALGKVVCSLLQSSGHHVAVYDMAGDPTVADVFVRGDIRDGWRLLAFAKEQRIEGLVHLASLLGPESEANPGLATDVNCKGFLNVCETARHLGIRRLVWTSSMSALGYFDEIELRDDAPYSPSTVYAATKVLNEVLALHYHKNYGIETMSLRLSTMLAAGKTAGGSGILSEALINRPVRGQEGNLPWGTGSANWLWMGDAAEVICRALTNPTLKARHCNVGGEHRSLADAVEIIKALIPGARIKLGSQHRVRPLINMEVLKRELGFTPTWKLEDQLAELVKQARETLALTETT